MTMIRVPACVVIFAGLSLMACASSPVPTKDRVELGESAVENVERFVRDGQPGTAYQLLDRYQNEPERGLSHDVVLRLTQAVIEKTRQLLDEATAARDYAKARALGSNLAFLGDTTSGTDGSAAAEVALYLERQNHVLAVEAFFRLKDPAALEPGLLTRFSGSVTALGHQDAASALLDVFRRKQLSPPEELTEIAARGTIPSAVVDASVTIWVDRGIRFERGIGLPDRVIGSGFFIDPSGHILTNYHVIESEVDPKFEGYSRLYIKLPNGPETRIPARVVGYDKIFDLALLKAETTPKAIVTFPRQVDSKPGIRIFAVGSPGGLENTLTSGIVSAVGRRFLQIGDAMQIDVPVNPGNSGGPLVDEDGRLAGVVFAGIEQFEGINFAIPLSWVRRILPKLYAAGETAHSWLGLAIAERRGSFEVLYVDPTSPGGRAGVKKGDIVVTVQGSSFKNLVELQGFVSGLHPQTLLRVELDRGNERRSLVLAVEERPYAPLEARIETTPKEDLFPVLFGFSAVLTSRGIFSEDYTVTRVYPGTIADEAGLSENDPFSLRRWVYDKKNEAVLMQILVRKRTAGFLEGGVQVGAYIKVNNFI